MGIYRRAGHDASVRGGVLHMGCQDQRYERGDTRMGIAGACSQRAADYQLGVRKFAPDLTSKR